MTELLNLAKLGRRPEASRTESAACQLVWGLPGLARNLRALPVPQQREYVDALMQITERGTQCPASIEILKLTTSRS